MEQIQNGGLQQYPKPFYLQLGPSHPWDQSVSGFKTSLS